MCSISTSYAAYFLCTIKIDDLSICPVPLHPTRGGSHQEEIWAVKIKLTFGFGGAGARGETIFNPSFFKEGMPGAL